MRLAEQPLLPRDVPGLVLALTRLLRENATQVNLLSEGYVQAATNAGTAAPTAGTFNQGDFVRNSAPAEIGAPGGKYIVTGWTCVAAGTPGTWLEARALTGN
jgi:hypothetical protein